MTGFATSEAQLSEQARLTARWDIRSVNSKGLDIKLRLPRDCEQYEPLFQSCIKQKLARGSVQASLTIESSQGSNKSTQIDFSQLESVRQALNDNGIDGIATEALLRLPGIVQFSEKDALKETLETLGNKLGDQLAEILDTALERLAEARLNEGAALAKVVGDQLNSIHTAVEALSKKLPKANQQLHERLAARLNDLLPENLVSSLPPDRLSQEVAILCTKADITEELDRLKAHLDASQALLKDGEPIGRKLEFLTQEFNREANTICSKSPNIEITNLGLSLKSAIDQIREQAANIQ